MLKDIDSILKIIRSTRDITLPHFGIATIADYKSERAHDVVTELDREVEKFLATEFKKIEPDIEFVGEEFGGNRGSKRYWLVDPIDGTGLFVRGMPFCTTMVALVEENQVTFSGIYDFVKDELYHAVRGHGSFKNGERIRVSDRGITNAYVGFETHLEKAENLERYLKLKVLAPPVKLMCAGYEYALIASGRLEARICFDPYGKDYDFAPGTLLVEEAGGVVANLGSRSYSLSIPDHIDANRSVFESLTDGPNALFPINN